MGAIFFLVFLIAIFLTALLVTVFCSTFLIVLKAGKLRGKSIKKRWTVIPALVLILSIIVLMLPIGFIGFLRYTNNKDFEEVVYAKSGIFINWPTTEYNNPDTNWFETNGNKYMLFNPYLLNQKFTFNITTDNCMEALYNIRYNPEYSDYFGDFMILLLTGKTRDEQDIETLYPVKNESCFDLIYLYHKFGGEVFCHEAEFDLVKSFYGDISNYDTENIIIIKTVFSHEETENYNRFTEITTSVNLNSFLFEELLEKKFAGQGINRVKVPEIYIKISDEEKAGTSYYGYERRDLYAYSRDEVANITVSLALIDGLVYLIDESGHGYIKGYPLSGGQNDYIKDKLFN